ncbi:hypothetical protein [Paenibacillus silviterrae]|uniref:hypothetical protein n=1 Tax=Paenibacillus silviterrae TaxID=3242194 RepID=UPI002543ADE3|nr:hypothetical protein [Paenibacillus chinjuensis]
MRIPQGNEKLTIELSLKEAMALASGVRFHEQPGLLAEAKRKLRSQMEQLLLPESDKLHYQLIEA